MGNQPSNNNNQIARVSNRVSNVEGEQARYNYMVGEQYSQLSSITRTTQRDVSAVQRDVAECKDDMDKISRFATQECNRLHTRISDVKNQNKSAIEKANSRMNSISTNVEQLNQGMNYFGKDLARINVEIGNKYSELSTSLKTTQNGVSTVQGDLAQFKSVQDVINYVTAKESDKLNTQIAEVNNRNQSAIEKVDTRMNTISTNVEQLNQGMNYFGKDLARISVESGKQYSELSNSLKTTQNGVSTVQGDLAQFKAVQDVINYFAAKESDKLNTQIADVDNRNLSAIDKVDTRMNSISTNVEDLKQGTSDFQKDQSKFNIESGKKYSELSTNLKKTKNVVSTVNRVLVQFKDDQDTINRASMMESKSVNRQIADIDNRGQAAFERADTRMNSISTGLEHLKQGINNAFAVQAGTIECYVKNQTKAVNKKTQKVASVVKELEKHGQLMADNLNSVDNRATALRTDFDSFTGQTADALSKVQDGMGNFKSNQNTINQTVMQASDELLNKTCELKKDMKSVRTKMDKKTSSLEEQHKRLKALVYWLIAFVIAMMAAVASNAFLSRESNSTQLKTTA